MSAPHPTKAQSAVIRGKVEALAKAGRTPKEIAYEIGYSHTRACTLLRVVGMERVYLTKAERELIAEKRRAA